MAILSPILYNFIRVLIAPPPLEESHAYKDMRQSCDRLWSILKAKVAKKEKATNEDRTHDLLFTRQAL